MNNLAISPYIGLHALQIQNVKRNVVKKASISELNNNIDIIDYHENSDSNENNEIINNNQNDTNDNDNNNDNDMIPEPHFIDDNIFGTEIN
jgi:hypothetical protein